MDFYVLKKANDINNMIIAQFSIKQFLLIVLFLLSLNSCVKKDDGRINELNIQFEKIADIEMHDLQVLDAIDFVQPIGENYILFLNRTSKILSRLDLEKLSLTNICTLQTNEIQGWFYDAKKNECYIENLSDSIIKFDKNGLAIGEFAIPKFKTGFFEINTMRNFRPLVNDGIIEFYYSPKVDGNFKNRQFFYMPIEGAINLKDSFMMFANQTYPSNYQQHCYGYNIILDRIVISNSIHAYAFSYNDSIFIYNYKTKQKSKKFFGSRTEKKFSYISYDDIDNTNDEVFEKLMNNTTYLNSGYAPLSKIYYRWMMGFDSKSDTIKINNTCTKKKSSLILYDNDFNYIGESKPSFDGGILVDSKRGLLKMNFIHNKIILKKLIW